MSFIERILCKRIGFYYGSQMMINYSTLLNVKIFYLLHNNNDFFMYYLDHHYFRSLLYFDHPNIKIINDQIHMK